MFYNIFYSNCVNEIIMYFLLRILCSATLLVSIALVPHLECCSVCLERAIWRMYDNDMTRTRQWYDNGWGECQLITRAVCFHISYTTEPNLSSDTSTRQMVRRTIYLRLLQYSVVQYLMYGWIQFNIDFAHRLSIIFEPGLRKSGVSHCEANI